MPDIIEKKDVIESQKIVEEPKKHSDLDSLDVKQLISIIEDTRGEAASRRIEAKQLKEKLEAIELKEAKEAEEKLKKNGDYEKILSEKETLISGLSEKAKAFDEYYNSEIENAKKVLGENWEDEFSKLSLPAIKKLTSTFTKEAIKKVDHDDPTKQKKEESKIELTESDKGEALRRYPNVSPERAYELYKGNLITKLEREKLKDKK